MKKNGLTKPFFFNGRLFYSTPNALSTASSGVEQNNKLNLDANSDGTKAKSLAAFAGNKIFLAPESNQICNTSAKSDTLFIVPAIVIVPNTATDDIMDFFNPALYKAISSASDNSLDPPTPCKSAICIK